MLALVAGRNQKKYFQGGKGAVAPQILINDCFKKGARDLPPPSEETYRRFSDFLRRRTPANAGARRQTLACALRILLHTYRNKQLITQTPLTTTALVEPPAGS